LGIYTFRMIKIIVIVYAKDTYGFVCDFDNSQF